MFETPRSVKALSFSDAISQGMGVLRHQRHFVDGPAWCIHACLKLSDDCRRDMLGSSWRNSRRAQLPGSHGEWVWRRDFHMEQQVAAGGGDWRVSELGQWWLSELSAAGL